MDENEINQDLWKAAGTIDLLQQDLQDAVILLMGCETLLKLMALVNHRPEGDPLRDGIAEFLGRPQIKKITEGK